ncbi:MAG: hypothetical protein JNM93_10615 [Bacteriovoracaceae bacterium]|nr:hypothetical protein [Bacteriovoracaceae bacterium]
MEKILNYKNTPTLKIKTNSLDKLLATSMPEALNIYQRAHLIKSTAVADVSHNDFKIIFGISGEISGFVVCKANLENVTSNEKRHGFLQGLFVESMNILLGKIFTNIENAHSLMSYLSPPKILTTAAQQPMLFKELKKFEEAAKPITTAYSLKIDQDIIECSMTFEIIQTGIIEV